MFSAETLKRMTHEKRKRISLLGVQAQELKSMALDPPIPMGVIVAAWSNHYILYPLCGSRNRYVHIYDG